MKKEKFLILVTLALFFLMPNTKALAIEDIDNVYKYIVGIETQEQLNFLITKGYDETYIKSLDSEDLKLLLSLNTDVYKSTEYYKTVQYNGTNYISENKISKEQFTREISKKILKTNLYATTSVDIIGPTETNYKTITITRQLISGSKYRITLTTTWSGLPAKRGLDFQSFVYGSNIQNIFSNFYSYQAFSQGNEAYYSKMTSVWNNASIDSATGDATYAFIEGNTNAYAQGYNYSLPKTARYDLVNDATSLKLISAFDIDQFNPSLGYSAIYNHCIMDTCNLSDASLQSIVHPAQAIPTVAIGTKQGGVPGYQQQYSRQTLYRNY